VADWAGSFVTEGVAERHLLYVVIRKQGLGRGFAGRAEAGRADAAVAALINIISIKAVSAVNNVGVFFEITGSVVAAACCSSGPS
jgi:hypothetical protein